MYIIIYIYIYNVMCICLLYMFFESVTFGIGASWWNLCCTMLHHLPVFPGVAHGRSSGSSRRLCAKVAVVRPAEQLLHISAAPGIAGRSTWSYAWELGDRLHWNPLQFCCSWGHMSAPVQGVLLNSKPLWADSLGLSPWWQFFVRRTHGLQAWKT